MRMISIIAIIMLTGCATAEKQPAYYCPATEKINQSLFEWTDEDTEVMMGVRKRNRCAAHYPELPCLKKFFKRGIRTYHAECGVKVRR